MCEENEQTNGIIELALERGTCCSCRKPLREKGNHVNYVMLDKRATWEYPVWGNVLVKESFQRALAFVCDQCVEEKKSPRYAIQVHYPIGIPGDSEILYHRISGLESVPKITEQGLRNLSCEEENALN